MGGLHGGRTRDRAARRTSSPGWGVGTGVGIATPGEWGPAVPRPVPSGPAGPGQSLPGPVLPLLPVQVRVALHPPP